MNELKEKLAEWAGFKHFTDKHPPLVGFSGIPYEVGWLYPNGYAHYDTPNFTKSLDDCFEWLVPKLDKVTIKYDYGSVEPFWCRVNGEYTTIAQTFALSLCLAIEKLIDGEK